MFKIMAVSQGKQKKHVQAIQKQDIIQYFPSLGRHPAISCRAGPHSEHAAIFEETSTTTTNISSAAFPPALLTKHGYYMVQNIASVTLRPLYHLIYSQIIAVPSILMHGENLVTVQVLVRGSQALLSYQHCFSHQCKAGHRTVSYIETSETKHVIKINIKKLLKKN